MNHRTHSSALEAILATCDDSLERLRNRALRCLGYTSGGRQRNEIAAGMRDLRLIGDKGYAQRIEHSETQQAGVTASSPSDKPVFDRAALVLEDWLDASRITDGPFFQLLWKRRVSPALSPPQQVRPCCKHPPHAQISD